MPKFTVTYERCTEKDIEIGETDDRGFVLKDASLREALQSGLNFQDPSHASYCEPNDSRATHTTWLSFPEWNNGTREYYRTGIIEGRALHFPTSLTPSSRRRLVHLFRR